VIEQFYEDAKGECGLGDYQEGRRWDGVHRHLALVMVAYSFLAVHSSIHPEGSVEEKEDLFPLRKAHYYATGQIHRRVLEWLLEDLVLWFIETERIKTFRPSS
jgi:hypothetical protein